MDSELVAVIGYDGSDTSKAALAHAARRIGGEGRLVIVHAAEAPRMGAPRRDSVFDEIDAELLLGARYETELVGGAPARALIEAARDRRAAEIYVGARQFGLISGGLGRVCRAVLEEADRPVTVVPPGFDPDLLL